MPTKPKVVPVGKIEPPKRGTPAFFRDLHPMVGMDPDAPVIPIHWLVPGIMMEGKINMMFGPEKSGKSRWLRWMLAHMFYGKQLYGNPTHLTGRVLYLAGEEQPNEITAGIMRNVKLLGLDPKAVDWQDKVTYVAAAGMRLDRHDQRNWIRHELETGPYDNLIIDPLRRVHAAHENDNDEMSLINNALREWSNSLGTTILIIHHTGKLREEDDDNRIATWSRGATDVASVLDWASYVTRLDQTTVRIRRAGRASPRGDLSVLDQGEGKPWILNKGEL